MDKSSFSKRLNRALSLRNMSQKDLRDKTGLGKSAVSQYVNGLIIPKQDKLLNIANALEVSPIWLMGYDVPLDEENDKTPIPAWYSLNYLNDDTVHNDIVELIKKLRKKHPNDLEIEQLISIISSYLTHIDNLKLNDMIASNTKHVVKVQSDLLGDYYHLNKNGKKLVDDYIQMIYSNSEYRQDDIQAYHDDKQGVFYFYFKNIKDNSNEKE